MKRKVVLGMIAAMVMSMAVPVYALPSVSQIVPEAPKVLSENVLAEGETLKAVNADTSKYTNEAAKEAVDTINDDNRTASLTDVVEKLLPEGTDLTKVLTTDNNEVDLTQYDFATIAVDLVLELNDGVISYDSKGNIKAEVTIEAAKDKKKEDLLIMQIDPKTGETYFIEIEDLDPVTGKITATFPVLGPIVLLEKTAE